MASSVSAPPRAVAVGLASRSPATAGCGPTTFPVSDPSVPDAAAQPSSAQTAPTSSICTFVFFNIALSLMTSDQYGPRQRARPTRLFPPVHGNRRLPSLLSLRRWHRLHAAEADVRHAGVRGAPVPGAGPVARAVAGVAQKRPALLAAQRRVRLAGVEALRWPLGVDGHPLAGAVAVEVDLIPVA